MGAFSDWLFGSPQERAAFGVGGYGEETYGGVDVPEQDAPDILPPSRVSTPRTVSTGDAFSLSMVYRAIGIHAIAAKQMSLNVWRNDAQIDTPALVRQPNVDMSRSAFIEQTVVSLAATGNAYWRVIRDSADRVVNLIPLNPLDVLIETNSVGTITGYKHRGTELKRDDVKHLSLLRVPGTAYGLGPIQAAQPELRGALDTRDYAGNWFEDSGVPTGVLKSDQVLSPEAAKSAKDAWNTTQGGSRGVAVLGNGLTYSPIFLSPKDAQFIEAQSFNVTQIARLFGVPSSLMLAAVEGNSQTYSNVEQDWLGYVRFSLMAYLVEIEEALSSLIPRGQTVRFNVDALLRSDTTTRYAAHSVAIASGFLTVDEVRAIENLPPLGASAVPEPAPEEDPAS